MHTPKLLDGSPKESVLHMNSGDGTNSYAANSTGQRYVLMLTRPILEESVTKTYSKSLSDHFTMADLGCASGPNSLEAAATVIQVITGLCGPIGKSTPEILVFLNDLPGNDFNSVSMALPAFYERLKKKNDEGKIIIGSNKCFVCLMPGSFYGRLFPTSSLHFVHSSFSIHWLSQIPNGLEDSKGSICADSTCSVSVWEAYLKQFQRDFTLFLSCRAQEMLPQGQMVLTLLGKATSDPRDKASCFSWEWLSKCLLDMAAEGLVEEKDIDSFNLPIYMPCEEEVRDLVEKEGSFVIDKLETVRQNIGPFSGDEEEDVKLRTAKISASGMRAVTEPLLTSHFGEGLMMDDLYQRVERIAVQYFSSETPRTWAFPQPKNERKLRLYHSSILGGVWMDGM